MHSTATIRGQIINAIEDNDKVISVKYDNNCDIWCIKQ